MNAGYGTVYGTVVVDSYVLPITGIQMSAGTIMIVASEEMVSRDVHLRDGGLVRICGVDGSSIASFRLPLTEPMTVKLGYGVTMHLPLQFTEFVGRAKWPQIVEEDGVDTT